jgi:hypothetical protein
MSDPKAIAARVLELDAEATKGPWGSHRIDSTGARSVCRKGDLRLRWIAHTMRYDKPEGDPTTGNANADLIAEYRTAAPALAREVLALTDALAAERADVAQLRAKLAEIDDTVRVHQQVSESGLRIGTRVLYAPSLGGKAYAGVVASEPRIVGGCEVVRLEEMEPAYGKETGTQRKTVAAAAVTHLFVEDAE